MAISKASFMHVAHVAMLKQGRVSASSKGSVAQETIRRAASWRNSTQQNQSTKRQVPEQPTSPSDKSTSVQDDKVRQDTARKLEGSSPKKDGVIQGETSTQVGKSVSVSINASTLTDDPQEAFADHNNSEKSASMQTSRHDANAQTEDGVFGDNSPRSAQNSGNETGVLRDLQSNTPPNTVTSGTDGLGDSQQANRGTSTDGEDISAVSSDDEKLDKMVMKALVPKNDAAQTEMANLKERLSKLLNLVDNLNTASLTTETSANDKAFTSAELLEALNQLPSEERAAILCQLQGKLSPEHYKQVLTKASVDPRSDNVYHNNEVVMALIDLVQNLNKPMTQISHDRPTPKTSSAMSNTAVNTEQNQPGEVDENSAANLRIDNSSRGNREAELAKVIETSVDRIANRLKLSDGQKNKLKIVVVDYLELESLIQNEPENKSEIASLASKYHSKVKSFESELDEQQTDNLNQAASEQEGIGENGDPDPYLQWRSVLGYFGGMFETAARSHQFPPHNKAHLVHRDFRFAFDFIAEGERIDFVALRKQLRL